MSPTMQYTQRLASRLQFAVGGVNLYYDSVMSLMTNSEQSRYRLPIHRLARRGNSERKCASHDTHESIQVHRNSCPVATGEVEAENAGAQRCINPTEVTPGGLQQNATRDGLSDPGLDQVVCRKHLSERRSGRGRQVARTCRGPCYLPWAPLLSRRHFRPPQFDSNIEFYRTAVAWKPDPVLQSYSALVFI
ncbi:uncharacterized protein BCR38DRAFT_117874 [Pseudomassariella vexata]|uniref:Uncharacterized protein n=1 Tax=Pseudomassariella vexata TaxID=1141098 RepID=A0A1Y2DAR1_9PEZI|nr:uncharacterized protein BCR38DRAFT_117874 [Pseudomassariella vexata]ORY56361.1 hypothetical protein BCR38DRAFT_117874 [Pseudomassariella vexata]